MFKTMQQQRVVQTQRIKTVLHITEQLHKSFDELENCHFEQQNNVQGELKKEMTQLQKKIIKETVSTFYYYFLSVRLNGETGAAAPIIRVLNFPKVLVVSKSGSYCTKVLEFGKCKA